ncbi:tRNA nucleotidyltransferase [Pseudoalteromonas lipolytica]|uniref:tRNA nucleotidyltransferase n=1 Tax=Pseudoalteromonas lipolytica TaxID=570156 RepID=UPI003BA01C07
MQVYLVGGAVRDALLGREVKERDYVVVGATPEQLIKQGYQQVGKDFPVFLHPKTKEEYALARTERKQGQGYTGFICDFTPDVTLEQDLIRRDLTVNAIAQAEDGTLVDPFGGQSDIENRLLRHVSDAFSEDPLRILRVARFAARYHYLGFSIAPETERLLIAMVKAGELETLTAERVWLECEKSLSDGAFAEFLNTLFKIGGLHVISPTLESKWSDALYQTMQARFDYANKHSITDTALLFSQVTLSLTESDIHTIAQQIRLPNEVRDVALNTVAHRSILSDKQPDCDALLGCFNRLDLWRRPERLNAVLKALEISEQKPVACITQLHQVTEQASAVDPQQFIVQGIKGADIKTALENARLSIIKNYFS